MKKLFTFAAAILASVTMMAGVNVFTEQAQVINDGNWIVTGPDNAASSQSSVIFPDDEMEPGFPTGTQTAANYFKMNGTGDLGDKLATTKRSTIKNLAEGDVITVYWFATNTTKSTITLSYAHQAGKGTKLYDSDPVTPVAKTVYASVLPALTADDIDHIANGYEGTAGLGYISCNNSVYVYAVKIGAETPSTDPVASVEIEGPEAVYVGKAAAYTATTDVKADEYKWFVNDVEQEGAETKNFEYTPEAEGTFNIVCKAKNANNEDWVASAPIALVASVKPAATVCAELYPAASGPEPAQYAEVALKEESNGGRIIFVDAKEASGVPDFVNSFLYTDYGLQMCKGGKDSVRVILDKELEAGSTIELKIRVQVDEKTRGFNLQTLGKQTVLAAAWVPSETDFERTYTYDVVENDGIAGKNAFIIARSNTAILEHVIVSGCAEGGETAIENAEEAVKAVKFFQNGQLFIEMNGVIYNAQGAIVK